jgi:hypothetical protein
LQLENQLQDGIKASSAHRRRTFARYGDDPENAAAQQLLMLIAIE